MRTTYYIAGLPFSSELYHHGIIGQKWGVRRYQNPDGSLTPEGRKRYLNSYDGGRKMDKLRSGYSRYDEKSVTNANKDPNFFEKDEKRLSKEYDPSLGSLLEMADRESGLSKAYQKEAVLFEKRRKNKNPFKSQEIQDQMRQAHQETVDAFNDFRTLSLNLTMEQIEHMPKDKRDEAMYYVYSRSGYDW